jgi:hypothetical protein
LQPSDKSYYICPPNNIEQTLLGIQHGFSRVALIEQGDMLSTLFLPMKFRIFTQFLERSKIAFLAVIGE